MIREIESAKRSSWKCYLGQKHNFETLSGKEETEILNRYGLLSVGCHRDSLFDTDVEQYNFVLRCKDCGAMFLEQSYGDIKYTKR